MNEIHRVMFDLESYTGSRGQLGQLELVRDGFVKIRIRRGWQGFAILGKFHHVYFHPGYGFGKISKVHPFTLPVQQDYSHDEYTPTHTPISPIWQHLDHAIPSLEYN